MSLNNLVQNDFIQEEVFLGRTKWFNNRSGYGFITITDGPRTGSDIFAHHSGIVVSNEQYKYLVQGEYVEFKLEKSNGDHEYQAVDIRGVKGGKLMCETRRELQEIRNTYKKSENMEESSRVVKRESREPREPKKPSEPREFKDNGKDNGKDWTMVKSSRSRVPNPKSRLRPV